MLIDIQLLIPTISPNPEKTLLTMAINAINTKSIAATFTAILIPSPVPMDIADNKLEPILSLEILISVFIFSV